VKGGRETDDDSFCAPAAEILVLVLNEEYRLSPEKLFPTGFEDSFDVVCWVCSLLAVAVG
jgi:acetyl esterase/lipase